MNRADVLKIMKEELPEIIREAFGAPKGDDRFVDANEAARILGMTVLAVRKAGERGMLQRYKIGSRVRYKVSELLAQCSEAKRTEGANCTPARISAPSLHC